MAKLRLIGGDGPFCPRCKGGDIEPAHGSEIKLEDGHGHAVTGTVN